MRWLSKHLLLGIFVSRVICDTGKCGTKLLNDYKKVPDSAFSATSYYIPTDSSKKKADFSAKASRESYDKDNQEYAWCPFNQVETSLSEYLEIDLGRLTMVKVVQTKGRFAQGAGKEFTPFYKIRYSRDYEQQWKDYKKFKDKEFQDILNGPNDAFLDAFETLDPPIVARWLRIFPFSHKSKRVCLKLQLFGCDFTNNVLEYQTQQGTPAMISNSMLSSQNERSFSDVNYSCMDNTYDGYSDGGYLRGGLGLLTDNSTGADLTNKTSELLDFVGWFKGAFNQLNEFISIKFIFMNSRNFTSVKIHSYSKPSMQVDYFSQIHILFSDNDQSYDRRVRKADSLLHFIHTDHSIDIDLRGCYGRYVKINFYFQSQWILLSEISFTSESRHLYNKSEAEIVHKLNKETREKDKQSLATLTKNHNKVHYQVLTTVTSNLSDKATGLEIIYILSILLCLLVFVITITCSFWLIIKRKKSQRKKIIKKQALALCSQSPFIPYNHNSNSLQCLAKSVPPVSMSSMGIYPSYTIERRNYPNGTLRTVTKLSGYHPHSSAIDQNGMLNQHCNVDPNIYTSIVGSDNDSSLTPEYATTSITNEVTYPHTFSDTPTSYLPPPIEPIRATGYCDSIRSNSDRPSIFYTHPKNPQNTQDSVSIWRINDVHNSDIDRPYIPQNQMSFNDYPYLKYNNSNTQEKYDLCSSSKYRELPSINSHF